MRKLILVLSLLSIAMMLMGQASIGTKVSVGTKVSIAAKALAGPVVLKTGGTGTTVGTCNSGTTTCALTYTPNATGDWAILGVFYNSSHVVTGVTDNGGAGGSTYAQITGVATVNTNERMTVYCTTALASSVTTITAAGGGVGIMIVEGSGGTGPCTLDQANSTANLTTPSTNWTSSATSATTNANDICIGLAFDSSHQDPTWAGTNGYTALTGNIEASDGWGLTTAYKVVSSTGAQTATGTVLAADSVWTAIWVLE